MAGKSKGPDNNRKRLAAERAAEARRRIAGEQRRRRMITVAGAVGAIVVVIAVFVIVKVVSDKNSPESGVKAGPASAAVATTLAGVPASVFDTIGTGTSVLKSAPKQTSGSPLTGDGKPRVLYVGAEWCPYCAAERWPLALALERFGDLSGLQQVSSSPSDVYANTATISFAGATYTSSYLAFTGKELQTNQVAGGRYTTLDTITGGDKALFDKAGAGYPFIDLGGSSRILAAQYDPAVLKGRTQAQIAAALTQPKSDIAEGIVGSANLITAKLCTLTGNAPAAVCSSSAVKTAASALPTG